MSGNGDGSRWCHAGCICRCADGEVGKSGEQFTEHRCEGAALQVGEFLEGEEVQSPAHGVEGQQPAVVGLDDIVREVHVQLPHALPVDNIARADHDSISPAALVHLAWSRRVAHGYACG